MNDATGAPPPDAKRVKEALTRLKSDVAGAELTRTVIEVTGDDRARFLHNYCTNDINRLVVGSGCEAFFTSLQGKTLLHAFVFSHDDKFVIDAYPQQADLLIAHLQKYALLDDVELTDRSSESKQWLVMGPKSIDALSQAGMNGPDEMLSHQRFGEVVVHRVPLATVPCFLVQTFDESAGNDLKKQLTQDSGEFVSETVIEAARIEARFPRFGQDITSENLPQEIGRDTATISFTKGCYLGQETVARIDALGHVNKYLLAFESQDVLNVGDEVFVTNEREKVVGSLTSVVPLGELHLALGYLRRDVIEAKREVETATAKLVLSKSN